MRWNVTAHRTLVGYIYLDRDWSVSFPRKYCHDYTSTEKKNAALVVLLVAVCCLVWWFGVRTRLFG